MTKIRSLLLGCSFLLLASNPVLADRAAGPGTTPNVAAAGRGVDDLVKVDGKWLISVRNVAPQD